MPHHRPRRSPGSVPFGHAVRWSWGLFFPRRREQCDPTARRPTEPPITLLHARPHHHHRPDLGRPSGPTDAPSKRRWPGQRTAGRGPGRGRRALRGSATGSGASCWPGSGSSCCSTGTRPSSSSVPWPAWGTEYHGRGVLGRRDRRGRGGRVPHLGPRPHRAGRGHEPLLLPQRRPGLGHRPPEPPAGRSTWSSRAGPTCPAQAELFIPGGRAFRDLTRSSAAGAAHRGPGLRQLHRRRGLRPRHERLHRDDRPALQGVPGRAAAGQDGHRRGVRPTRSWAGPPCTPGCPGWPTTWPPTSSTPSGWGARS